MTSWAAVKMKKSIGSACEGTPTLSRELTFHDAESPRETEQTPRVHSAPVESAHQTLRRPSIAAAGKAVVDWAGNHAADWVTLSVAGWLAAQAAQAADGPVLTPQ